MSFIERYTTIVEAMEARHGYQPMGLEMAAVGLIKALQAELAQWKLGSATVNDRLLGVVERLTKRNRTLESEAGELGESLGEIADIQREKLEREKRSRVMDANEARSREQELRAEVERLRQRIEGARWLLERAEQLAQKNAPGLTADIDAWLHPSPGIAHDGCNYLAAPDSICTKCGQLVPKSGAGHG